MARLMLVIIVALLAFGQARFDKKDPREIIEKIRIYRLTEELDLTDEQAVKFFPKLKELRKVEQDFFEERRSVIIELKALLKADADPEKIKSVIDAYRDLMKKRMEAQKNNLEEIQKLLSPVQQAKFIVFQEEFENEIREVIKQVKKFKEP